MGDRLPDPLLKLVLGQPGRVADDLLLRVPARHRAGPQHLLGGVGDLLEPGEEQRGEAGRKDASRPVAAAVPGRQQLLAVVRVPLGPGDDPVQGGRIQRALRQRAQMVGHVGVPERGQLDGGHPGQAEQLRDHRPQRMTAVQVVGAVGDHHRHLFPVQHPAQEGEQVAGGAVGPVKVFQHEQHGPLGRQFGEHSQDSAEQLLLRETRQIGRRRACAAVGQQAPEHRARGDRVEHGLVRAGAGGRRTQRVGERQVRDAVAQLGAPAGEHGESAARGPRGQLRHQAGLAHAGVPANERVCGAAALGGVVEQVEQAAQFAVPADQPLTRYTQHIAIIPAGRGEGGAVGDYSWRPVKVDVAGQG